jgi:hypothetical protein
MRRGLRRSGRALAATVAAVAVVEAGAIAGSFISKTPARGGRSGALLLLTTAHRVPGIKASPFMADPDTDTFAMFS